MAQLQYSKYFLYECNKLMTRSIMSEKINKKLIQELRELTGLGLTDCKNALEESHGNVQQSIELLRKKGAAVANKRSGKATAEGIVQAYIHPGNQIGVLV